ncbi:transposase [Streptomyces sp. TE33382]
MQQRGPQPGLTRPHDRRVGVHGHYGRQIHAAWQARNCCAISSVWPSAAPTSPPTTPRCPPPATASSHLADHAHLPELLTLAETIEQWWDGIETYLITGIASAASEDSNRFTKLEARNAYRKTSSVSSKHSLVQPFMQLLRREGE